MIMRVPRRYELTVMPLGVRLRAASALTANRVSERLGALVRGDV